MKSIVRPASALLLGLAITAAGAPARAAPPPAHAATEADAWVAVAALRGQATGSPARLWRAALRDDEALRQHPKRGLALYYALVAGPGPADAQRIQVSAPVRDGEITLQPGAYHVTATLIARRDLGAQTAPRP